MSSLLALEKGLLIFLYNSIMKATKNVSVGIAQNVDAINLLQDIMNES